MLITFKTYFVKTYYVKNLFNNHNYIPKIIEKL